MDACCAVAGNDCHRDHDPPYCTDHTSSSDWLFGLWPGPPQRFEPTGTSTYYQIVNLWPHWGNFDDLSISQGGGAPGGSHGRCSQGHTYRGTKNEICGGYQLSLIHI